nr:tyrosine-type recombinase/integrase [Chania multitudinisentens]
MVEVSCCRQREAGTRPGELRQAEWGEFDFDKALWEIPASKMKMRRPHLVPLSKQAITQFKLQSRAGRNPGPCQS